MTVTCTMYQQMYKIKSKYLETLLKRVFYAWNESIDLLIDIALKMKCQTKEFNQFYQQVVIPLCLKETREGSSCTDEHSKFWQEKKSVKCAESLLCC